MDPLPLCLVPEGSALHIQDEVDSCIALHHHTLSSGAKGCEEGCPCPDHKVAAAKHPN